MALATTWRQLERRKPMLEAALSCWITLGSRHHTLTG